MRTRLSMRHPFGILVATINAAAVLSVTGDIGALLELQRRGLSIVAVLTHGASPWAWSIELWVASVGASRLLLRSGRLDLAVLTALLPLVALLGVRISAVL